MVPNDKEEKLLELAEKMTGLKDYHNIINEAIGFELIKYSEKYDELKEKTELMPVDLKEAYIAYIDTFMNLTDVMKIYKNEISRILNHISLIVIELKDIVDADEPDIFSIAQDNLKYAKRKIKYLKTKNKSLDKMSAEIRKIITSSLDGFKEDLTETKQINKSIEKIIKQIDKLGEIFKTQEDDLF